MTRLGPDTSVTTYFSLIRDTTRSDTLEWTTESTSYSLIDRSLACTWCPKNRPLVNDERGLGRGGDNEGIIKGTGTSLEGRACGTGLPASIGQRFQFVDEQAPRVLQ